MNSYEAFLNSRVHIDQRALLDQTFQSALKKFDKNKRKTSSKLTSQNYSLSSNPNSNTISQAYASRRITSYSDQNVNSNNLISNQISSSDLKSDYGLSRFSSSNSIDQPRYVSSSRYNDTQQSFPSSRQVEQPQYVSSSKYAEHPKTFLYSRSIRPVASSRSIDQPQFLSSSRSLDQPQLFSSANPVDQPKPFSSSNSIEKQQSFSSSKQIEKQQSFSSTRPIEQSKSFTSSQLIEPQQSLPSASPFDQPKSFSSSKYIEKQSFSSTRSIDQPNSYSSSSKLREQQPPLSSNYSTLTHENDLSNSENKMFGFHFESIDKDLKYSFNKVNLSDDDEDLKFTPQEEKELNELFKNGNQISSLPTFSSQLDFTEKFQTLPSSQPFTPNDPVQVQLPTIDIEDIPNEPETLPQSPQDIPQYNKEEEIKKFREQLMKRILKRKEKDVEEQQDKPKFNSLKTQVSAQKENNGNNKRIENSSKIPNNSKVLSSINNNNSPPKNNLAPSIDSIAYSKTLNNDSQQPTFPISSIAPSENTNQLIKNNANQPQDFPNSQMASDNQINLEYTYKKSQQLNTPTSSVTSYDIYQQTSSNPNSKSLKSADTIIPQKNIHNASTAAFSNANYSKQMNYNVVDDLIEISSPTLPSKNQKITKNSTQPSLIEKSQSFANSSDNNNLNSIKPIHSLEEIKAQNQAMFKKEGEFLSQMEEDLKIEKEAVNSKLSSIRPTDLINAFKQRMMNFTSNSFGTQNHQSQPNNNNNNNNCDKDINEILSKTNDDKDINEILSKTNDNDDLLLCENDELNLLDNEDFNFPNSIRSNIDSLNENEYNISEGNNDYSFDSSCFIQLHDYPSMNTDDFESIESKLNCPKQANNDANGNVDSNIILND